MILTKEIAQRVLAKRNLTDLQDIKQCLKNWRDNWGLEIPKLNSKGYIIISFFQELQAKCDNFMCVMGFQRYRLFNNQLKNVGDKSRKTLLTKLA